jgi:hypothetical protein
VEAISRRQCEDAGNGDAWVQGYGSGYSRGMDVGMRDKNGAQPMISDGLGNPRTLEPLPGEGRGEPLGAQAAFH